MASSRTPEQKVIDDLTARVAALEREAAEPKVQATLAGTSRQLDTPFTIDSVTACLIAYTVELSVTAILLTLTEIRVDLQVNGITLQTASLGITANGLSLSLTQTIRQTLFHLAHPGDTIKLASTGGGSATLLSSTEVVL